MSNLLEAVGDATVITKRNLIKIKRVPDLLVFTTLSPIMFVLLFAYVFGGAIQAPGIGYRSFLIAGIFAQTVVFGATFTGYSIAEDLQKGIIDRFRSLPMAPSAVLFGRTLADVATNVISLSVMGLTGLIIGWRIHTSFLEALGGFLLSSRLTTNKVTIAWRANRFLSRQPFRNVRSRECAARSMRSWPRRSIRINWIYWPHSKEK